MQTILHAVPKKSPLLRDSVGRRATPRDTNYLEFEDSRGPVGVVANLARLQSWGLWRCYEAPSVRPQLSLEEVIERTKHSRLGSGLRHTHDGTECRRLVSGIDVRIALPGGYTRHGSRVASGVLSHKTGLFAQRRRRGEFGGRRRSPARSSSNRCAEIAPVEKLRPSLRTHDRRRNQDPM